MGAHTAAGGGVARFFFVLWSGGFDGALLIYVSFSFVLLCFVVVGRCIDMESRVTFILRGRLRSMEKGEARIEQVSFGRVYLEYYV